MFVFIDATIQFLAEWAKGRPYLRLVFRAARKGYRENDKDSAASIAYFTFLSLFPLVLGLISLGGFVLKSEEMQLRVNQLVVDTIPISADFVTQITNSLVRIRGAVGVTGALVLIWSASKMVGALTRAINRALGQKPRYAVILSPLRNFAVTILVATLLLLTFAIAPLLELLADLQLDSLGVRGNAVIGVVASKTSGFLTTIFVVGIIYGLMPYKRLPFATILPGLLTAVVLVEIGKAVFVWYVETASSYSAVYGSVSSIIVLHLWLYFSARIVLFGAEVISIKAENP